MRTLSKVLVLIFMLTGLAFSQTKVNPVSQINWPLITGAGTPTTLSIACTSVNYGQPYQNTAVTPNTYYTCGTDGWNIRGGGGGGGSFSGITSGTNSVAAMVVGSGASIAPTGTGAITATGPLASGATKGLSTGDG